MSHFFTGDTGLFAMRGRYFRYFRTEAMLNEIKRVLINQCGPVLMGIKPAALFPLQSGSCFARLSRILPRNIDLFVLREIGTPAGKRPLVFLYEETMLKKALSPGAARRFLSGLGYPAAASVFHVLEHLKTRFSGNGFPHEVGLFLGYPLEDVTGFVRHGGRNYKLLGYWKVYGDVERAKALFRRYDFCRKRMETYWKRAVEAGRRPASLSFPKTRQNSIFTPGPPAFPALS